MDHNINESYQKFDVMGPVDCRRPEEGEKMLTQYSFQKTTAMDGEIATIQIPIFERDSAKDVQDRIGALLAPLQKRMFDNNQALLAQEKAAVEHRHELEKKKVEHQLAVKHMNEEAKMKKKKAKLGVVDGSDEKADN
jgi:hypothetical protein